MKKFLIILLSVFILGCGGKFVRNGTPDEQMRQDYWECEQWATQCYPKDFFAWAMAMERCMGQKGYKRGGN